MKRDVMLVHGLWDTDAIFTDMIEALSNSNYCCHSLNWQPNNGAQPIAHYAEQLRTAIAQMDSVSLVTFSMGGIISRYLLQMLGATNVDRLITIATPHHGTLLANTYWPIKKQRPGAFELARGSTLLTTLNEGTVPVPMTCIWSPYDQVIVPNRSATHPEATNIKVKVALHDRLSRHPMVIREVCRALER